MIFFFKAETKNGRKERFTDDNDERCCEWEPYLRVSML